jgi:5-oxoprolinase (ATP-hydrolysing)
MEGGGSGALGRNTWIKQIRKEDGDFVEGIGPTRDINIGGKATVWMGKGDRLLIETPGGGAWGAVDPLERNGLQDGKDEVKYTKAWEPRGSFAQRAAVQAEF